VPAPVIEHAIVAMLQTTENPHKPIENHARPIARHVSE
jgi:hypothetical protein